MTPSTQTVSAVESPSGYIMSHNTFNILYVKLYGNNRHNKLSLTNAKGVTGIHVEFINMAIGSSLERGFSGDEFRLSSNLTDELYSCRDIRMPPPPQHLPINSATSFLFLSLTTDSVNRVSGKNGAGKMAQVKMAQVKMAQVKMAQVKMAQVKMAQVIMAQVKMAQMAK